MLRHDRRGISQLKPYLPANNYVETARFILERPGRVLLTTGFYVNGIAETDGPPGAAVLARALQKLGYEVTLVTDRYCLPLLKNGFYGEIKQIEFPILDESLSKAYAEKLLAELDPALLISVERCGLTRQGDYRNMRGVDISPYTARLDFLFNGKGSTVGIGDGGNEIGMGLLYEQIYALPELIPHPTVTPTSRLLISSVSNWAACGLVAALSELSGVYLLPDFETVWESVRQIVDLGSTDGMSGLAEYQVDGFSEEINREILENLHAYLKERLVPEGI